MSKESTKEIRLEYIKPKKNRPKEEKAGYIQVTATVYNPVPGQTDGTPDITASGFNIDTSNPYRHRIIAVSRDLFKKLGINYGDYVKIQGKLPDKYKGVFRVEDTMNKRWTNRIDFLTDDTKGKWICEIKKL